MAEHHNPVAKNYAMALLNMARRKGNIPEISQNARLMLEVISHERQKLRRFIMSPQIPTDDKIALVERALGGRIDPLLVNLLKMLVLRDRCQFLTDVLVIFSKMAAEEMGLRTGVVATAVELSDAEKERIESSLEAFARQNLLLTFRVDPNLIGGVVFQSGDELVDNSVRGRLNSLKKRLEAIKV